MKNIRQKLLGLKPKQDGMASIIVVITLIIILGLISVGFTRIMNREVTQSFNSQLASEAEYAAESGVNEVITYVKNFPNPPPANNCNALFTPTGTIKQDISGDGNVEYTCILLDPKPLSLEYTINAFHSRMITLDPSPLKILLSWQSPNASSATAYVPKSSGQPLYDQTQWGTQMTVLRVTFYPITDTGSLVDAATGKTFFFYPNQAVGGDTVASIDYQTETTGQPTPVNCGTKDLGGAFNGAADHDCNVVITNIPNGQSSNERYYVRVTPLYNDAQLQVQGNGTNSHLTAVGNQVLIDVTAKAADVVKRIQARVTFSDNLVLPADSFPEYALRSAKTICKRLTVNALTVVPDATCPTP